MGRRNEKRAVHVAVSDLDIWRSANEMIKQHGEKAWTEAVLKYFEMKRAKDLCGIAVWRRIARAISDFTDPTPRPPN
jgi:hypothetical protein